MEGSTQLLRELGDDYGDVLAEHRRILREAFAVSGGREVDAQGDSFFAVFGSVRDAVAAAVGAQRALAAHEWPRAARLRVRIGIHTGEPAETPGGYVGLAVHRCARICAAANGGQVLLSSAARTVLGDDAFPDVAFRDLGEHPLKDFAAPERIHQLLVDDLPPDLRPLRAAAAQEEDPVPVEGRTEALAAPPAVRRPSFELRPALTAAARNPFYVAAVAVLILVGATRTAWAWAAAVPLAALAVYLAGRRVRRAADDSAGFRLYSMRRLAPDPELSTRMQELGAVLVQAAGVLRDVDDRLGAQDRTGLAHLLATRRGAALTAGDARAVDALARSIDAVDALAERRAALGREVHRVEGRVDHLRELLFETRAGHVPRQTLLGELVSLHADLEDCVLAVRSQLAGVPRPALPARRRRRLPRLAPSPEARAASTVTSIAAMRDDGRSRR